MLVPLRTDSPLRNTPWTNWALIAANIIIYALSRQFPLFASRYVLDPVHPRLLNYITYAFLHEGWMHVLTNMLFLYVFGNNVNDRMGNWGYLGFYLAGAVFAGIAYVVFDKHPLLGASGAVTAVTGAYLVLLPRSHVTVVYYLIILVGLAEIPSGWLILGYYVLQDVVLQLMQNRMPGGGGNVAHIAHLGGTLFGFAVCLLMLAVNLLPRDQFDVLALIQRWNRRRQFTALVRSGYDPFGYVPPRRIEPDLNAERLQDLRAAIGESIIRHDLPTAVHAYLEMQSLDPRQVLSRQNQLDIANQLYADGNHAAAAAAYELFITTYPKYENLEHVRLMLGILYARYLQRAEAARVQLKLALERLHNDRERDLARAELDRMGPPPSPPPSPSISPV